MFTRVKFTFFKKRKEINTVVPYLNPNVQATLNSLTVPPHQSQQVTHGDPTIAEDNRSQVDVDLVMANPSSSAPLDLVEYPIMSPVHDHMQVSVFGAGPSSSIPEDSTTTNISTSDEHRQILQQKQIAEQERVFFGQDHAFNQVCDFLSDNEVGMLGIYGMGGVGKSVFMKKICNEFLVPLNFTVIWVYVSKVVDMDKIQKCIMERMNIPFDENENPIKRANEINKAFGEKKVALLIDDLWDSIDLEELGILGRIKLDASIFKIIFTTRSGEVCDMMEPDASIKMESLGWKDSWAMFEKIVGKKTLQSDDRNLTIAKEIVKECKGLPLALKVIGQAMTGKFSPQEWENALQSIRNSNPSSVDLLNRLKHGYNALPDRGEKECFLYCCLYPEDKEISTRYLIDYWIAEGFLALNDSFYEARNRGYEIVGSLLRAAMLIESGDNIVKMHDVIRDLGLFIVSELNLNYFVHGAVQLPKHQIADMWREAHRIYVMKGDILPEQPLCLNLSTLVIEYSNPNIKIRNDFFQSMCRLRVLHLSYVDFLDLPVAMGLLVELRYLRISFTNLKTLPREIGNLSKLLVLELFYNMKLRRLPESIGHLIELRMIKMDPGPRVLPVELNNLTKLEILDMDSNDYIEVIPSSIFQNMPGLTTLRLTVKCLKILPADMWVLRKLKILTIDFMREGLIREDINEHFPQLDLDHAEFIDSLAQLSSSLRCLHLRNWSIASWYELLVAVQNMDQLSELEISGCQFKILVLLACSRLPSLEELVISFCPILEKIQVRQLGFQNLLKLEIIGCGSLKYIFGLQHLGCLVKLKIECGEIEELIKADEEMKGWHNICFPKLKYIQLGCLRELKSICNDAVLFPSLTHFDLKNCPKVQKLPRGLMNEGRTLEAGEIRGKEEWWEKLLWQDDYFKSFLRPRFVDADSFVH